MPEPTRCPDPAGYRRLAADRLPAAERDALLAHLEGCPACAERVARLSDAGTLAELVRGAGTAAADAAVAGLIDRLSRLRPDETPPDGARAADTVTWQPADATPADPTSVLTPPQAEGEVGRLGPYRVLRVLGAGGMGVVFHAEDPQLGRAAALKVLRPEVAVRPDARERFLREARAAAAVRHDHVVTVYQVGEDRGVPFLAMELLDGESLEARLRRDGKLPVAEVLRVGREVALGLAAAHEAGLVHRDVKPSNVWLEAGTGRVKILDFGLARPTGGDAGLTHPGAILGSPAYMAPEQARGRGVDHRADLFSLGCVLYRAAAGAPAFRDGDTVSALVSVSIESPRPPRELDPSLPHGLSALILALLSKDPAGRPASARAVADELDRIARGAPPPAAGRRGYVFPAVAAAVLAAVLLPLLAVVLVRVTTPDGTLVVETDDPDAEVVVTDPRGVAVRYGPDRREVRLRPGEYGVELTQPKDGLTLSATKFTIPSGGRRTIEVRWEKKPAPVAPAARAVSFVSGDWRVEDGELVQAKPGPATLLFGDKTWADYDVSLETKTVGVKGAGRQGGAVLFRVEDPSNYHVFALGSYGGTWNEVHRNERGRWVRDIGPLRMDYEIDRWHPVKVSVRGERFRCWLDGQELFAYADPHFPRGQVGLATWDSVVRWRNVRVTDPDGKVLFEGVPDLPPRASGPAEPPKEPPAAGDRLPAGSVWGGTRTYRRGAYAGVTVSYELHVRERDGVTFRGHVFDNGPGRNRSEVEGELAGDTLTWRERPAHDPAIVMTMRATLDGDTLRVTFRGDYGRGITNDGDGELTLGRRIVPGPVKK